MTKPAVEDKGMTGDALRLFQDIRKSAPDVKPKFEAGEHIWLGDEGAKKACADASTSLDDFLKVRRLHSAIELRYGEIVALSGDFYGSPADLFEEKTAALPWLWQPNNLDALRSHFDEELAWIEQQKRGETVGYPDNNVALAWHAKSYVELALDNNDHFGWHNMVAYCRHHVAALERACEAYRTGDNSKRREAIYYNGFADHFLTDGFAAGHIRVPRAEIRAWGAEKGFSEKLAGALSKLLHDQDGHVSSYHGESEPDRAADDQGLLVKNSKGDVWNTRCDGQLFISSREDKTLIAEPVAAVAASVTELLTALATGKSPEGAYAAAVHVPFPHPDEPTLCDKFAPSRTDLAALVNSTKWYVKIPWIGAGLGESDIAALFSVLPTLMGRMNAAVKADIAANRELERRLPAAYIEAFSTLR